MSKRVYITLNPKKDKDKIILDYLSSTYNESETIKSLLYTVATNRYDMVQIGDRINDISNGNKEQITAKSYEKVIKGEESNNNETILDKEIMEFFQ